MTSYEHEVIDRESQAQVRVGAQSDEDRVGSRYAVAIPTRSAGLADERAARVSLRAQIARLERARSAIVAERFPHIPAPVASSSEGSTGPVLLDLGGLERVRDQLAADVQDLRGRVRERIERERRAREQLQRMRLDPGSYKFARMPVRDLGQGVCGVWEVRPRLGLIGMLAGWWQLKLSSGCPLARGSRSTRDPGSQR